MSRPAGESKRGSKGDWTRDSKGQQPRLSLKAPAGSSAIPDPLPTGAPDGGPSEAVRANSLATTVTAYLLAGPLTYGGIGWLVDRWLGSAWALPLGAVLGMGLSLWTVWLRYGTSQATPTDASASLPAALPQNEENQ